MSKAVIFSSNRDAALNNLEKVAREQALFLSGRQTMAGSPCNDLRLKFLFANQDGVHVVLRVAKTATVAQVKTRLLRSWPESTWPLPSVCAWCTNTNVLLVDVPSAQDTHAVRLVCMGRGILQDAQKVGAAVPVFATHPTPVNVSVNYKPQPTVRGTRALLHKVRRLVGS